MKLKTNSNMLKFLRLVQKCQGEVFFDTEEGDHLNLKSVLSQYLFSAISDNAEFLKNGYVCCKVEADYKILEEYLTEE